MPASIASSAIVEDEQLQCLANSPFLIVGNVKAQGSIEVAAFNHSYICLSHYIFYFYIQKKL